MARLKKRSIITTVILIGILTAGVTVYAVVQDKEHKENIEIAIKEIKLEKQTLVEISMQLEGYNLNGGYIAEDLTAEKLDEIKNNLDSIRDSYTDFHIEKDELKEDIKLIKVDKKDIEQQLKELDKKLKLQNMVNGLFIEGAIVGTDVIDQVVFDNLNKDEIEKIKTKHIGTVGKDTDWETSLISSLDNVVAQLEQIDIAKKEVEGLYIDDKVVSGVSIDTYNKAKSEVDKVKNERVKKTLSDKLAKVYSQIQDISNLSEQEIARRSLALFKQLYEDGNTDTTYNTSIFSFDEYKGGIQYIKVIGFVDAENRGSYAIEKNGDITFYDGVPGGSMEISESKTANIFTDVDETLLNSIREDVTDLDSSIWEEIESQQGY